MSIDVITLVNEWHVVLFVVLIVLAVKTRGWEDNERGHTVLALI